MMFKKFIRIILPCALALTILFAELPYTQAAYAATLRYYDYTTSSNVNYTGKQVNYTYNGRELPLSNPGIIINGTALADYEELFVNELGLQAVRQENVITITDGNTVLELTLNSKKAKINGQEQTMSVAPIKISFDGNIKYYVPTRFVTEAFGLTYVWVSSSSTAKITKTLTLTVDEKEITYNGTFYSVNYEEQAIPLELPGFYCNGVVLVPAKTVFEAAGCLYNEAEQKIQIFKGDIVIQMELGSKAAFVNGKKWIVDMEPVQITEHSTEHSSVYVSLEFVAEMLGFELSYEEYSRRYTLIETESTGSAALYPESENWSKNTELPEPVPEEIQPEKYYYEWISEEPVYKEPEYKYISKIVAYSLEKADVLELYGVTRDDINDFIDSGVLVFELKSVLTNMDTQYFNDFTNPHLTYTLLTEINHSTKLFLMLQPEDKWHFVEKEDCVQVYFTNADLSVEDLFASAVTDSTQIPVAYPDDKLIIPIAESIEASQISDQDNYLERNFQIILPGNQVEFYENNAIINPYYQIKENAIFYDSISDHTVITFYTRSICGYTYALENGYLIVNVAKPNEIYAKIVVLDAGHGGIDPGAAKNGYKEKDINFTILNTYVKDLFEASSADIKVYFTRESDVLIDLYERAAFSAEVGADMFLSLHMNANNTTSVSGTEVYYSTDNNQTQASGLNSYNLAKTLVNNLSTAMGTKNRGVSKAEFVVTKYNTVPAVLIELGFMTNQADLAKLTNATYHQKAAEAIYQSVLEIFETYPTGR